eukprot:1620710-Pleurochrysis_carterae.AAC.3
MHSAELALCGTRKYIKLKQQQALRPVLPADTESGASLRYAGPLQAHTCDTRTTPEMSLRSVDEEQHHIHECCQQPQHDRTVARLCDPWKEITGCARASRAAHHNLRSATCSSCICIGFRCEEKTSMME